MRLLFKYKTKAGTFYIGQSDDGRFHPIYDDESLGSYEYDWQAASDLAMDATFTVLHYKTGEVLDTSELGIPEDIGEWEAIN